MICSGCHQEIAESELSCPQCSRLVHGAELEELAQRARASWRVGRFTEERALWELSLRLLPQDTVQFRSIQARIHELDEQAAAASASSRAGGRKRRWEPDPFWSCF